DRRQLRSWPERNFRRSDPYDRVTSPRSNPRKEQCMTASPSRFSLVALAVMAGLAGFVTTTPLPAQAVSNSAEFEAWRKVQTQDIDVLRKKFMALAKVVPADKLGWRPMEGTRSFHDVFAHVAAEGNTETAMFGGKLPAGSLADFDAEEAPLAQPPDDQPIRVHGKANQSLPPTPAPLSPPHTHNPLP